MANTTTLKRRITSVRNTRQITKAMELVSASKMRRAQEHALRSRAFRNLARDMLARLNEVVDVSKHPLYQERPVRNRLHVLITSDRGLAGAYNSNLMRRMLSELQADREAGITSSVVLIGKQGARVVARLEEVEVIASYESFAEQPTANDIRPILDTLVSRFREQAVDAVDVTFTDYVSSITQEVKTERLLPAAVRVERVPEVLREALVEPHPQVVLAEVTERILEADLNQMLNESQASEQSARMMAMKNASDNADDLTSDLTQVFNTARQASITQELAEITGGAEAIS